MVQTRIPAAIDALVALFQGAGLATLDGPILSGDEYPVGCVYVGFDGDYNEGEERAVTSVQEWAGLGKLVRREDLQIAGAVTYVTGNAATTWKSARDSAVALLETIGQVLRADPSIGLGPPAVAGDFVAELWPGDMFQENGPAGMQVRIVFAIHCKTRV